jgi:hypothetical protein
MIVFVLLSASASVGLVIGLFLLRALAIVLASLCLALLSAAILLDQGFGWVRSGLISAGSLTALQGAYLLGAWIRLRCALPFSEIIRRAAGRTDRAKQHPSIASDVQDPLEARVKVPARRRV